MGWLVKRRRSGSHDRCELPDLGRYHQDSPEVGSYWICEECRSIWTVVVDAVDTWRLETTLARRKRHKRGVIFLQECADIDLTETGQDGTVRLKVEK